MRKYLADCVINQLKTDQKNMTFRAGRLLEVGIAVDKLDEASEDISYLLNTPLSPPIVENENFSICLLYTSPSPRDRTRSRMPSSA